MILAENLPSIDGTLYRSISGQWLTGVTVVTTRDEHDRAVGLTMSAVSPLSLNPPQFLVNLDLGSETLTAILVRKAFCINFLGSNQREVCSQFAKKGSDKFAGMAHRSGELGMPVIEGAIAYVECTVADVFNSGDHSIIVGDARYGKVSGGSPLAYFRSAFRELAHCE